MSRLTFSRVKPNKNYTEHLTFSFMACIMVTLAASILLCPDLAIAATDAAHGKVAGEAELTSAFNNIKGLVSGVIGKIVTIVALGFGLAGSIFKFNPAAIAGSFGVALTAAFGPSAVVAVIGATF